MTWTKLGDEFPDEAAPLSDAAFRTHVEALGWSNRRLLDLTIRKGDVKRFAETADPAAAIDELVAAGWWEVRGEFYWIGCKFPDWQRDRAQVVHRREQLAQAQRRKRRHEVGDHSLCLPGRCKYLSPDESTVDRPDDPGRDGTGRDGIYEVQEVPDQVPDDVDPATGEYLGGPVPWESESAARPSRCASCSEPLDSVLAAAGETTHPSCEATRRSA